MTQTALTPPAAATLPQTWAALRALGNLLDTPLDADGTVPRPRFLAVVEGGLVGALEDPAGTADAYLALTDAELATLMADGSARRGQPQSPLQPTALAPTGYGDLLRALALWARADGWTNLRLLFLPDRLCVSYGSAGHRQERLLDRADVEAVLDAAYRQRQDPRAPLRMPPLAWAGPRPSWQPVPRSVGRAMPYARDLALVGRRLDQEGATEPLVAETRDGLVAVTLDADGRQRARVVDPAASSRRRWWRRVGECEAALAALGARLDATGGHHALLAPRPTGDWLLCSTIARDRRIVSGDPLRRPRPERVTRPLVA